MHDKAVKLRAEGSTSRGWRLDTLIWLLLLCVFLLPACFVMKTVWDGQDVDWLGIKLVAAGPKNDALRDISALLQQIFSGLLVVVLPLLFLHRRKLVSRCKQR